MRRRRWRWFFAGFCVAAHSTLAVSEGGAPAQSVATGLLIAVLVVVNS